VRLPMHGNGEAPVTASYYAPDNNRDYTGLLDVWDQYNTGFQTSGAPSGWVNNEYWSATPSTNGHAAVRLNNGSVNLSNDFSNSYVALEVL